MTVTDMDKYDEAIEYLTKNPKEIFNAWMEPDKHVAGCLFVFAAPEGEYGDGTAGCLTMIRKKESDFVIGSDGKIDEDLTRQIRGDERLPDCSGNIEVDDLPVFAEWQRRLDKELDRT